MRLVALASITDDSILWKASHYRQSYILFGTTVFPNCLTDAIQVPLYQMNSEIRNNDPDSTLKF